MTDFDLSKAVAKKLGWSDLRYSRRWGAMALRGRRFTDSHIQDVTQYSTDIAACFNELEPKIAPIRLNHYDDEWTCWYGDDTGYCNATTPSEAICKAFLAMEEE